jgi:hypothetical protein
MSPDLDRRSFLKLVGGGIVVLVRLGPSRAIAQGGEYPKDFNSANGGCSSSLSWRSACCWTY